MHKLTVIKFTDNERRLLAEVIPLMGIMYGKVGDEEIEAHKSVNALQEIAPIPRRRLEKARRFLKALKDTVQKQSFVEYWQKLAREEGVEDLGDVKDPRSGAYMAQVLTESRRGFCTTITRALGLLDEAIEASSPEPEREKYDG